jgi:hypothetical protein
LAARGTRCRGVHVAWRTSESRIPDPGSQVPDPAALWSKVRLIQRWEAERRAQRPLDIMQPIEIAGGPVVAGLLLYWSLPYLL